MFVNSCCVYIGPPKKDCQYFQTKLFVDKMWCRIMISLASQRKKIEIPMVLMPYIWTLIWKCGWLIPNLFSLRCPCIYVVEGSVTLIKKSISTPCVLEVNVCVCSQFAYWRFSAVAGSSSCCDSPCLFKFLLHWII